MKGDKKSSLKKLCKKIGFTGVYTQRPNADNASALLAF